MNVEEQLVKLLTEKKLTITTAESCTGGMVSSALVNVPGASSVLNEAYVTYSNESKHRILGVREDTLNTLGAVSYETAEQMAKGAAEAAGADCAISVTGIAGPDGGTEDKPVGTVYTGFYVLGDVEVIKYNFSGDRFEVRNRTAEAVIGHMLEILQRS